MKVKRPQKQVVLGADTDTIESWLRLSMQRVLCSPLPDAPKDTTTHTLTGSIALQVLGVLLAHKQGRRSKLIQSLKKMGFAL